MQRIALALTIVNLGLLALNLTLVRSPAAEQSARAVERSPAPAVSRSIRTQALEIVDGRGRVRSRLDVEQDGEVVLRLIDGDGTIRVKLGAGEGGSGLLLLDETTEPGVQILARRSPTSQRPHTTHLTLSGADGRKRVIEP